MNPEQETIMTHIPESNIPNPHAETEAWFTPAEWETFRTEDLRAGRFVIILMATIFSLGILIYSVVLWSVL